MPITTIPRRELYQNTGKALRESARGPVFITNRGKPSRVLLSMDEYRKITKRDKTLADVFGYPPGIEDVELDIPQRRDHPRPADFS